MFFEMKVENFLKLLALNPIRRKLNCSLKLGGVIRLKKESMITIFQSKAMAQVGGLVMLQPDVGGPRENFFFAGIDKVRFRKPVVAGDTLVMRVTLCS